MSEEPQYLEQRYSNHYNKKPVILGDIEFKPMQLFITKKVTDRVNNTETYYIEVKRDVEEIKEDPFDKLARHEKTCDGEFTDVINGLYRFCSKCDWVFAVTECGEVVVMDSEDRKKAK